MGPTWGPPGSCRPQVGPMLVSWIVLSGRSYPTLKTLLLNCVTCQLFHDKSLCWCPYMLMLVIKVLLFVFNSNLPNCPSFKCHLCKIRYKNHDTTPLPHLFVKVNVILNKIMYFIVKQIHRLHNSLTELDITKLTSCFFNVLSLDPCWWARFIFGTL